MAEGTASLGVFGPYKDKYTGAPTTSPTVGAGISGYSNEYVPQFDNIPTDSGGVLGLSTIDTGAAAAPNPILQQVRDAQGNLFNTSQTAAQQFDPNFRLQVDASRTGLTGSQDALNERAVQAELGKRQSNADILGMVGRGIRSGGAMLAGRNALDSSAAGELAKAYGEIGRREGAGVERQYGLEVRDLAQQQGQLAQSKRDEDKRLRQVVTNERDRIVGKAQAELQLLNEQLIGAGVADRIAIEQEKQRIKEFVEVEFSDLDGYITTQLNVNPQSQAQAQAQAGELYTQGAGGGTQFDFSTEAPANFQGASNARLPIFTSSALRRRREE